MNFLISFRAEILKTKKTASWYLALFAAAIIPVIIFIDFSADGFLPENLKDPWNILFIEGSKGIGAMILPIYVILISTLLPQIEFRNHTWKQLFASPQSMVHVFFAKFLNVQLLIIFFLVVYNLLMSVSALSIHFMDASVGQGKPSVDIYSIFSINTKLYLSILAISALQFWLGLRFRNFVTSVATGILLWAIACIVLLQMHGSAPHLFPYAYPAMSMFPIYEEKLPGIQFASVAYAILFLGLGVIDFRRRMLRQ
jgi:lantibiotic transport system permease protein